VAVITAALSAVAPAWANADSGSRAEYVSAHASAGNADTSCASATFKTITAAVRAAPHGGTVVVCQGTYKEDVLISKPLTLRGHGSRIDATGLENGIQIVASNVTVRHLAVRNANGEGFLVGVDSLADAKLLQSRVLHSVRLVNVRAVNNDKGFNGTEKPNCKYPGDCGGGIHLNVVSGSVVRNSVAVGNADGILLTDDYGPAFGNRIVGNWVTDNKTECGIVLPSHSSTAVTFSKTTFALGHLNPPKAGCTRTSCLTT
jgi:nitrous oxidase accessory protein NosD